jgi:hypothetical protein
MRIGLLLSIAAIAVGGASASTDSSAATAACKPKLSGETVIYCGPATARLSVFPGVVFRNGSCRRSVVNGVPQLRATIGVRTQDAAKNNDRAYFGLTVSGPLSRPTGGGVIAYAKSKRSGGVGVAFRATANAGMFEASGIRGSHGHATGSFHC